MSLALAEQSVTLVHMDKRAVRARNLRRIVSTYDTAAEAAQAIGVHPSYLSQMLHPDPTSPNHRPISGKRAESIEKRLGLADGELSVDPDDDAADIPSTIEAFFGALRGQAGAIKHQQGATRANSEHTTSLEETVALALAAMCSVNEGSRDALVNAISMQKRRAEASGDLELAARAGRLLSAVRRPSAEEVIAQALERLAHIRNTGSS